MRQLHQRSACGLVITAGMNGQSSVREVSLETGEVRRKKMLEHSDFAEGVTKFGDKCVAPSKKLRSGRKVPLIVSPLLSLMLAQDGVDLMLSTVCRLFQLTWQSPKMFSYKVDNFDEVGDASASRSHFSLT